MLGIQDQGMVEERRHSNHEATEILRMLGETTADVPTGAQKSLTEALTAPQHNVGKDAYTVDLKSDEKLYWLGTESGLLGAFGFEGACTAGDGSCDPPTKSMGAGFCNFSTMQRASVTSTP